MATVKIGYANASNLASSLTALNSLAASTTVAWQGDVIDNTTNLYLDALVHCEFAMSATAVGGDKAVYVYAFGCTYDGSTTYYPDAVTVTGNATITLNAPTQLKLLGVVYTAAASNTYKSEPMPVASVFGGNMPQKWGIVVLNNNGTSALNSTGNVVHYVGVSATSA